jgi:hypothetical protein
VLRALTETAFEPRRIMAGFIGWADLAELRSGCQLDSGDKLLPAEAKDRVGFRRSSASSWKMFLVVTKNGSVSRAPGCGPSSGSGEETWTCSFVWAFSRADSTFGASSSACERSLTPYDHRSCYLARPP